MEKAKISINKRDVVLEIDDIDDCRFELWTIDKKTKSSVKIKIPESVWKDLVKQWKEQRGNK